MTPAEKTSLQEKLYGRTSLLTRKTGLQNTPQLVESPLLLSVREQAEKQTVKTGQSTTHESSLGAQNTAAKEKGSGASPSTPAGHRKQIECRTPDGKRRITPMFVPSQGRFEGGGGCGCGRRREWGGLGSGGDW